MDYHPPKILIQDAKRQSLKRDLIPSIVQFFFLKSIKDDATVLILDGSGVSYYKAEPF